jgi:PST family polysaccharide transporter
MFFNTQRYVSIIVFPIGIGLFLYSDLATNILLGSQWNEASKIIGNYALTNSIIIIFGYFSSEVYRAKGKPKLSLLAQILHLIVLVPICIISSHNGFWIFVYARMWIVLEFVIVHLIIMKFAMGFSILVIIKNVIPTLFSAAVMGVFGYILKQIDKGLLWSFVSIFICTIFYIVLMFAFPNIRQDVKKIVKDMKSKVR